MVLAAQVPVPRGIVGPVPLKNRPAMNRIRKTVVRLADALAVPAGLVDRGGQNGLVALDRQGGRVGNLPGLDFRVPIPFVISMVRFGCL